MCYSHVYTNEIAESSLKPQKVDAQHRDRQTGDQAHCKGHLFVTHTWMLEQIQREPHGKYLNCHLRGSDVVANDLCLANG